MNVIFECTQFKYEIKLRYTSMQIEWKATKMWTTASKSKNNKKSDANNRRLLMQWFVIDFHQNWFEQIMYTYYS